MAVYGCDRTVADKKAKTMRLLFNLTYLTTFGEELVLNILADGGECAGRHGMCTSDGTVWTCEVNMTCKPGDHICYFYSVEKSGRESRREWTVVPHRLDFVSEDCRVCTVHDLWNDIPADAHLYSTAFTECVAGRKVGRLPVAGFADVLCVKVRAPQIRGGERLALLGDAPCAGGWNPACACMMTECQPGEWAVCLDAARLARPVLEFKFVVLAGGNDTAPLWETGANRSLACTGQAGMVTYELGSPVFPLPRWKAAGTVVPVFALRSGGSFGVGDFGDLRMMVDWVAATGQQVLQVLPVNDTCASHTWTDSYPYNCISVYALHPLYTDFRQLPELRDAGRRAYYAALGRELNSLPQIDYERVAGAKTEYLRELFAQEWGAVSRRATFRRFLDANREWLVPYAAFCHYRDVYGTADHRRWLEAHRRLGTKERADMANPQTKRFREVAFWYFVQYWLDAQMRAVHDYARSRHVILKGDIPIGVSRDSVETWTEPRYFHDDGQAGAPPDAFSVNGQNWGFPTYNWDEMLSDGCAWWVRRLRKMSDYFDAYRIDHVLGFFRIWDIPSDAVHGLLGQFSPSLGMTRLEIEAYGLRFDESRFTQPYITDSVLERVFGSRAAEVRDVYLEPWDGRYRMRPDYDTQRKVEAAFAGKETEEDTALRDGLYAVINDVLFVRDRDCRDKFHPRIGVQADFVYESLTDSEKAVFNTLYDDYFYRRNSQFWYHGAMRKLPRLIQATRMLPCAEDLGMVPECVPWVMSGLRILSLEIQSMPKEYGVRFGNLANNPYLSVCTISTHDMPTLRQWWDEDADRAQEYYSTVLRRDGAAPHPLPGWLAKEILELHLESPSVLCVISLQDWLAVSDSLRLPDAGAERINIPSCPRHYWRYRMHLDIEELLRADRLNGEIREMVCRRNRR